MQALVLSPTRELAAQTEKNILALGEFLKVQAHCCIGGKSLGASPDMPRIVYTSVQGKPSHPKASASHQAMPALDTALQSFWFATVKPRE